MDQSGRLVIWCTWILCNVVFTTSDWAADLDRTFNYSDALGKAVLFFEGQRSGKLPKTQRVKWRGDSALSDGSYENVNLVGGYYDAGDNVKFGWPMAFTVTLLSWTTVEYEKEIKSVMQLEHLRSSVRWGADFILRAHVSPTTLYTQVGDANGDHQCWERPEDMDTPRTLYKITPDSPGTEAAAEAAAALAAASIVFNHVNTNYSRKLLQHSKSLFEFADKFRGSYSASCPFYCSYSGYQDELLWAAAWLYKASRNMKYLGYVLSNQWWSQPTSEFSWDNKFVGAQTLLTKEFYKGKKNLSKFKNDVESFICKVMPDGGSSEILRTNGGLLFLRDSSNLQYASSSSMVLFMYSKLLKQADIHGIHCGSKYFSSSRIKTFAKSQVDYILGKNPLKMSYMVGFGNKYPLQLHHRASSIPSIKAHSTKVGCDDGRSSYFYSKDPNPNIHIGSIVGGPDLNDQFSDLRSDYSHSEPTTYMNAAFVGSVAALVA
ncbi:hypothetical protein IC575_022763 [Cucumis melo]|uniref:Endoglucanase n=1 Tax=Cucumis melo TaxID=3656 RepID=A0A1S3AVA7_CUCME|nr:endoglucanase-like [Cucumis melo]